MSTIETMWWRRNKNQKYCKYKKRNLEFIYGNTKTRKQPKEKFYDMKQMKKSNLTIFIMWIWASHYAIFFCFDSSMGNDNLKRKGSSCTNESYWERPKKYVSLVIDIYL